VTDVQTTAPPSPTGLDKQPGGGSALVTPRGKTSIADSVVAKIAGLAAREISGVHAMGAGATRTFGSIREILPGNTEARTASQGVKVEVGERQAAIDLDLVVDYGVAIVDLSAAVRKNVIERLQRMTGLEVTEVNINVDDIWIPGGDDGDQQSPPSPSRVQ
jgi:uncharacterized alkaline shock family protein YloU